MSAHAHTAPSWTDPRSEARERSYRAAQPSLGLQAGARPAPASGPIERAVKLLLPTRSDKWMALARTIPPEDVRIWVPLTWASPILEFVSTPKHWACLWPCGDIEAFAPDDRRRRVVFMKPTEALALHGKHPLVDLSLHDKTLFLRFRRQYETPGTINAEPALRRACTALAATRPTGTATGEAA